MVGKGRAPGKGLGGSIRAGLALAFVVGCGGPPRPDVLLVSFDTSRSDHFGRPGAERPETPHFAALAAEGAVFLETVSPTPITLPSHASLLTGQLPPHHGVHNNGTYRLAPEAVTLAERFSDAGWSTAAFVGAAVLDHRYGLDQGFSTYDDRIRDPRFGRLHRRAERVVGPALEWLRGQPASTPTFVWVHFYDPHFPYDPPEPERSRFPFSPYRGEIAYADRMLGELLEGYQSLGRYEGAVIAVTADHGESLGEHGEPTHGVFIYDATVRVPLAIRAPGAPAGVVVASPVRLVDVAPTLLAEAGLDARPELDGQSLASAIRGGTLGGHRQAYLESFGAREWFGWSALRGLRVDGWKVIVGARRELYDLAADPGEQADLTEREPERVERMERALAPLSVSGESARLGLDAQTRGQLAALGYLQPARRIESASEDDGELPDPREKIHLLQLRLEAESLLASGDLEAAAARFEAILEEDPENPDALVEAASLRRRLGELERAKRLADRGLAVAPDSPALLTLRADICEEEGDLEEAARLYGAAWSVEPLSSEARAARWSLLTRMRRWELLLEESVVVLREDPNDGAAMIARAVAETGGEGGALRSRLVELQRLHPEDPDLALALALGSSDGLEPLLAAVRVHPEHTEASVEAARRLLELGRWEEAQRTVEAALLETGAEPRLQRLLAETFLRGGRIEEGLRELWEAVRGEPDIPFWPQAVELAAAVSEPATQLHLAELAAELGCFETARGLLRSAGASPGAEAIWERLRNEEAWTPPESIDPERVESLDEEGLARLGRSLLRADRAEEAVHWLREGQGRLTAEGWTVLAEALGRKGELEEAERAVFKALALQPMRTDTHSVRGAILLAAKRPREAVSSLRLAVALGDDTAATWSNLSWAEELAGRSEAARKARERAEGASGEVHCGGLH